MRVALFVPCYVDQLRPELGLAALEVLDAIGIQAEFPEDQTCCGQPFVSAGEVQLARRLAGHHLDVFEGYDAVVSLSGSCAATARHRHPEIAPGERAERIAARTFELCEFVVAHGAAEHAWGSFPARVGLHASCHALRELRLGSPSESRAKPTPDPARRLLGRVDDLELVELTRPDECCGFGGVFSIEEEAVSCRMGLDRLEDHRRAGATVIASTDLSCLLQLDGLARRRGDAMRMLHVAEVLALASGRMRPSEATGIPDVAP
jgi:L-lactate dehydrogenase complex protein LldE